MLHETPGASHAHVAVEGAAGECLADAVPGGIKADVLTVALDMGAAADSVMAGAGSDEGER